MIVWAGSSRGGGRVLCARLRGLREMGSHRKILQSKDGIRSVFFKRHDGHRVSGRLEREMGW